jgi:transcriptional regulator with GAF, ATPase, and Fis domain
VEHVSLTLVVAGGAVSNIGSSDAATELSGVQFALGEGPSVEAARTGVPVLLDDAQSPDATRRAPMFTAAAQQRGAAAVFAFPLRVGEALIGTLTAHRSTSGPLSAQQFADGLIVSSLATVALLQLEAAGSIGEVRVSFGTSNAEHAAVQVAAGMVSEQLSVTIIEALVRIRAHAFMSDAGLDDVARRIIDRSLRLER